MLTATSFEKSGLSWSKVEPMLRPLFGPLSAGLLKTLPALLEVVHLPGRETLFEQGDAGDAMYIVISGRLKVFLKSDGKVLEVREQGKTETIGEMALLSGEARSATIVAIRDCQLLRISKEAFEHLVGFVPAVGLNLGRMLISRFSGIAQRQVRHLSTVALLPIHPGIDTHGLAKNICSILRPGKTVSVVDRKIIDDQFGTGIAEIPFDYKADSNLLNAWLDQLESTHELMLYVADTQSTEWTKRCIRQADEVLLLADAGRSPEWTETESDLFQGMTSALHTRKVLVLIHPAGIQQPNNTGIWLQKRSHVQKHWHLRQDKLQDDLARLTRDLTGSSTGLVLSGGGAKGFAHIGVWRALKEAGINIDYIGATSMGAFIGGILALDADYLEVERVCREVARSRPSRDFHLFPVISLLKGKILDQVLQKHYGPFDMEDCLRPFFCISSNLTRAHPVIHHRGNMFKAIRSSGSLPGIVPPVVFDNSLLVDGGVFNNFPVDVMADLGVSRIIGVDLMANTESSYDVEDMPSNWEVIRRRWLSRKPPYRVPTIIDTIMETTTLFSTFKHKQARALTDICINPNVSRFGLMEWTAFDAIVEEGYREASKVLEKLNKANPTF
jgi:NTE family protein